MSLPVEISGETEVMYLGANFGLGGLAIPELERRLNSAVTRRGRL